MAVVKLTKEDLRWLRTALAPYRAPVTDPNAIAVYRAPGAVVTVYKTLTVQFQGPQAEKLKAQLLGDAPTIEEPEQPAPKPKKTDSAALTADKPHAGADEVGVGDYFGPVVAAAVYLDERGLSAAKRLGLRDSKSLGDAEIARKWKALAPLVAWGVGVVMPAEYNDMTINKKLSAHHVKTLAHRKAIDALQAALQKEVTVVLDQYASQPNLDRYAADLKVVALPVAVLVTKAEDKYPAVAAASLCARAAFLAEMRQLGEKHGVDLPLGAVNVVNKAKAIYAKIGAKGMAQIAKLHFKTTAQVIG